MKYLLDVIAAGGGSALVVFLMFRAFGEKIMNSQFDRLVERYKFKLNLEFDRISKLNQKEFEVLPVIWNKIVLLRSSLLFYLDQNKVIYHDLNTFSDEVLIKFLNEIPIEDYMKEQIRYSTDKNEMYKKVIETEGIEVVKNSFGEFDQYFKINKIFFNQKLLEILSEIHKFYFDSIGIFINLPTEKEIRLAFRKDVDNRSKEYLDKASLLIKNRLRFVDED